MQQNAPYISITDFMTPGQVRSMRSVLDEAGCKRHLGVGVMMSYKTLRGFQTKWSSAFPKNEEVKDIFLPDDGLFNVLHYADYDGITGIGDLMDALTFAGEHVHAFQLDMIWPRAAMLRALKQIAAGRGVALKFILQLNGPALEACEHNPDNVLFRLGEYEEVHCLDYVLFDLSSGQGKAMDARKLATYITATHAMFPKVGLAVAGGLGPTSMPLAEPVVAMLPSVSIDAQSKLRPSGNALDPIDWEFAATYLRAAAKMFSKHEPV